MDQLYQFIIAHSTIAPWLLFGLFLLAGLNIPISIDILIIIASLLSATIIPELTVPLYLSALCGCYFSAWLAYWLGRLFGEKLLQLRWMRQYLSPSRLEKLKAFYLKHGFLTLLIGRFIPFGVRNGIFMSTGMSRFSFKQFILRDLFPSFLWTTSAFFIFYTLGSNYELLVKYVKLINLLIFCAFGVTVIIFICYKRRKNNRNTKSGPVK
jgi:membrane protein DedA with SNARE-associated domain